MLLWKLGDDTEDYNIIIWHIPGGMQIVVIESIIKHSLNYLITWLMFWHIS